MPGARTQGSLNGPVAFPPDLHELQQYEQIVKIHDDIFSGQHPRLKVPQHLIRKVTPRSIQTPPLPAPVEQSTAAQPKMHPLASSAQSTPLSNGSAAAITEATGSHASATKTISEIDPIFLTKSDDLIRAEIQLQRQRIERNLRDHLDQKRLEYRQKTCLQESKPDFDVEEVLTKALELVKPISTSDIDGANANTAASDSFDENSFYSSKAPDSPQNVAQHEPVTVPNQQLHPMDIDQSDAEAHVGRANERAREYGIGHRSAEDSDMQASPFNIADKRAPMSRTPENVMVSGHSPNDNPIRDQPDVYDEPEYSPPGPDIPSSFSREEGDVIRETEPAYRRRSNGRPGDLGRQSRRNQSPPRDVRVVQNHITSPAAPQPSRVSPLAVSKVPPVTQNRHGRQPRYTDRSAAAQGSAHTSPEGPVQPLTSRKRRRIQESRDKLRMVDQARVPVSPDQPYIKPEPVSPPPLSDLPATAPLRHKQPHDRPTLIDIASPRYSPVGERRDAGPRAVVYDDRYVRHYDDGSPLEMAAPRSASRIALRRPQRDDQDLRRVASLQHIRQTEYANDYPEPVVSYQPRVVRASSYAVSDRPMPAERAQYYDEPAQPYSRRVLTREPSPPSPRYRESYADLEGDPRAMAPPPPPTRRIVVDEEGNRYIESWGTPKIAPVVNPRQARAETYGGAAPAPNGSVRAASIIEDPYRDRRYVQEMPPPPVTYRRAAEVPRGSVADRRYYDRDIEERVPAMRAASVQVVDYPRHATYVEEAPYPREEVVRMSSVRPAPPRYEEPREPLARLQSVRPTVREVSVYVDDEPRARREYAPVERAAPGYGAMRPIRDDGYYE
ncbi:hypothetical protein AJ80_04502 [Polytolypa hystricis UAMH7299]|uniref:Uncharacterized protein n=1 Tax=Polytolypa hystricis (strain UAMH7299) TaxID=1447883 RepID=A0A2B7Y2L6_POLH7|nr:hypothetical protein AJ80_04502 [Polytolypa hystricis UAMH7299]